MKGIKIVDSDPTITQGSRADHYWEKNGWNPYFKEVRPGLNLPASLRTNDPDQISKFFNLRGVGFGNWLTLEDRINYSFSLALAMYDLNKVMKVRYNMGFGLLAVSFGARGSGRALAHFEPGTNHINITRYVSGWFSKYSRFFSTGGLGSLAHEYGHFVDYFAGAYLDPSSEHWSLTGGHSLSTKRINEGQKGKIRKACDDLMEAIIWKIPGKKFSPYYERLKKNVDETDKGDYWLRRNELFARAFEVHTTEVLKKQGIRNRLLVSTDYSPTVYLKPSEGQKLIPKWEALLKEIRAEIK